MKRKVAKIGPSTLMISLPSKWCKHFNIQKGVELEVEEQGSELKIRTNENKTELETTVDISGLSERTIQRLIGMPNKVGYDIVNIRHENSQLEDINRIFKNLFIGFVISEQTGEKTILKKISNESEEEFDSILRRAFLITLNLAETTAKLIKEGQLSKLKDSLMLEVSNNQLTDYCHRLLIKFGYKNYIKTSFFYVIAWNLEKIADEYKDLIKYFSNKENVKLNKDILNLLEDISKKFKVYYELLYKFDINKLEEITSDIKKLKDNLINYENKLTKDETVVYAYLLKIADRLDNFSSNFVAVNLQ